MGSNLIKRVGMLFFLGIVFTVDAFVYFYGGDVIELFNNPVLFSIFITLPLLMIGGPVVVGLNIAFIAMILITIGKRRAGKDNNNLGQTGP